CASPSAGSRQRRSKQLTIIACCSGSAPIRASLCALRLRNSSGLAGAERMCASFVRYFHELNASSSYKFASQTRSIVGWGEEEGTTREPTMLARTAERVAIAEQARFHHAQAYRKGRLK